MKQALAELFQEVARRVAGRALVRAALSAGIAPAEGGRLHVLALGKVATPMVHGLFDVGVTPAAGLIIAPPDRLPGAATLPPDFLALPGDHPVASERSLAAGRAA